jgi:hypothetical protein
MPIDFGPSNSIIQSYIAGQQIARQRVQDRQDKEEKAQARLERQKSFDEQVKQFKERMAFDKEQWQKQVQLQETLRDIQGLDIRQKMVENYYKGITLPGMTEKNIGRAYTTSVSGSYGDGPDSFPIPEITPRGPSRVRVGLPNNLGEVVIPSKIDRAKEQAEIERIARAPEFENALELVDAKSINDAAIKGAELEAQKTRDAKLHDYAMALARERNRLRPSAVDNFLDRPLAPQFQLDNFGDYDPRRTGRSEFTAAQTLDKAQKAEFQDLDAISDAARDALDSLTNPKNPDYDKFKNFFIENGGAIETIGAGWKDFKVHLRGGELDATAAKLKAKLGLADTKIAVANFGKVIPSKEKDMLRSFSASGEHRQTLTSVVEKLKNMIDYNESLKARTLRDLKAPTVPGKEKIDIDLNQFIVK